MGVSLASEKSTSVKPAPLRSPLEAFPRNPGGWGRNAHGSNHRVGAPKRWPAVGHGSIPFEIEKPWVMLLML